MKITNIRIINPYKDFLGTIEIERGIIRRVIEGKAEGEDMKGLIAVPGFIDIHTQHRMV